MRLTILVAVAASCSGDGGDGGGSPHLVMDTLGTLAVGRYTPVEVRLVCTDAEGGDFTCLDVELDRIEEIAVSDPTVATATAPTVEAGAGRFRLQVNAPGSATVTVRGRDSQGRAHAVDGTFAARVPDRVDLVMRCDSLDATGPTWPVAVDQDFRVQVLTYAGDTYLHGFGAIPIDAGPFQVVWFDEALVLHAPGTPLYGTITTPVDPGARLDVQTYDVATIDGLTTRPIEGSPPEPIVLEGVATQVDLVTRYTIGGSAPCVADFGYRPRVSVFVDTQTRCGLDASGAQGTSQRDGIDPEFPIFADREGFCGGSVSLDGTSVVGRFRVAFASPLPTRTGSWAWENPLPQGEELTAIAGSGDDDIWAVGVNGVILHFGGAAWSLVASPTRAPLLDVWASGPNDAWAVGADGEVLHWDGLLWSVVATGLAPTLSGVWGRAPDDVWVVGGTAPSEPGLAFHWDGARWTQVATGAPRLLMAIVGVEDELWAVGHDVIVHFDGATWAPVPSPAGPLVLSTVTGTTTDDVWMSGTRVLHWNGMQLSEVAAPANVTTLAAAPGEVWAAGQGVAYRWSGSGWIPTPTGARGPSLGMWHAPGGDTWGVGLAGNIVRESGDVWTRVTTGVDGAGRTLHAVWAAAGDDVWAVGEESTASGPTTGLILHRDAAGWSIHTTTTYALHALWAASPSDVWAVGDHGTVLRWNGSLWSALPSGTTQRLSGVWGTAADDIWISGRTGDVLHFTGGPGFDFHVPETIVDIPNPPYTAVWASARDDVWVVGKPNWYEIVVTHWNGLRWGERDPPDGKGYDLAGVWGTAGDDVWIAGDSPFVYHWTGAWQAVFTGLGGGRVWGTSPSDVWIGGPTLHWDGATWTRQPPAGGTIESVHGTGPGQRWGVGASAGIHRRTP